MASESVYNPWHGCKKYSNGCLNCYVYRRDGSVRRDASVVQKTASFELPIAKKRDGSYKIPEKSVLYTCMTSDFFIEEADGWRPRVWEIIKERSDVEFIIITKRILRFSECIPSDWGNGYPNVTVMCTVEDQTECEKRLPLYISLPIAHKAIICEPLLSEIDLSPYLGPKISKVIAGGESGDNGRICRYEWVKALRDQCLRSGVGFYFKQTGTHFEKDGKLYTIPRSLQFIQANKSGLDI